jgi:Uma2 family endonuclease
MSTEAIAKIDYPDSDGLPMSDNTLQFRWIVTIQGGLDVLFRDDPGVFVAGDLLWYPVEGDNKTRIGPDVLVAFGRPKGERGSYMQWREDGIAPQVVFEVRSPGNRFSELLRKFRFYDRFGVEEYYLFDPDLVELSGWSRQAGELVEIPEMSGWISPRLGIRFELGDDLTIFGPDGRPFAPVLEVARQRDEAARQRDEAARRAHRLAEQLRALGVEPEG